MISDVLSDAVLRIEEYLHDMPDVYAYCRPRIDRVKEEMDALRAFLDRVPSVNPNEVSPTR